MRRGMSPMLCCVPDDASVRARIEAVVGTSLEVLPGSMPGDCSDCSCRVWLNPMHQIARRRQPDAVIVCITCGLPEVVLGHPVLAITQRPGVKS
jgi:hypothetical protein